MSQKKIYTEDEKKLIAALTKGAELLRVQRELAAKKNLPWDTECEFWFREVDVLLKS